MTIDRLDGITKIQNVQPMATPIRTEKPKQGKDTFTVSDEARRLADAQFLSQVAAETPDVRMDRVNEVRELLKDPNYINNARIFDTAEKFLQSLGI